MVNYSILTYIIGDYEVLREVKYNIKDYPHIEHICVTDNPNLKSDTWKVIYDSDLDNDYMTCWDKVFNIRYNLFKYCTNDICLRIDGSIELIKPVDDLIKEFNDNNYDGCFLIHGSRDSIINELISWFRFKEYSELEFLTQISIIHNKLKYDFNKKGLIEQTISINKRSKLTNIIDNDMLKLLCFNNNHLTRLDQTMFTAYITKVHSEQNWMFIDRSIMDGRYFQKYEHNNLNEKIFMKPPEEYLIPHFNNKKVETYKLL